MTNIERTLTEGTEAEQRAAQDAALDIVMKASVDAKMDDFVAYVTRLQEAHYKQYEHVAAPTVSAMVGPRYTRIVLHEKHGGRSVWGFVDRTSGDILKAAGWKTPAKHARGNIFDLRYEGMTAYGPARLR